LAIRPTRERVPLAFVDGRDGDLGGDACLHGPVVAAARTPQSLGGSQELARHRRDTARLRTAIHGVRYGAVSVPIGWRSDLVHWFMVTACTRAAGFERLLARSRRESTLQAPPLAARPSNEPHGASAGQRLYASPGGGSERPGSDCRRTVRDDFPRAAGRREYGPRVDQRLPLAAAACLTRFKGLSREHTPSDLRAFLGWRAERHIEPLQVQRNQLELYVRCAGDAPLQALHGVPAHLGGRRVLSHLRHRQRARALPAEYVRRPTDPPESPTLGPTHLQFEAMLTAARESANRFDFALAEQPDAATEDKIALRKVAESSTCASRTTWWLRAGMAPTTSTRLSGTSWPALPS
jgi:hypothetical protein